MANIYDNKLKIEVRRMLEQNAIEYPNTYRGLLDRTKVNEFYGDLTLSDLRKLAHNEETKNKLIELENLLFH
jgi:hypothetical protein